MANWRENCRYVQLRDAIRNKDKVTAQNLIRKKVIVNNPKLKSNTPLHWAIIQFEDLDIMKMLLNKGANVHAKNHRNLKPLDVAIQNNRTEAAILLIKKGALLGEDLNALLLKIIEKNNHTIFKNVIDNRTKYTYNISVDFKTLLNTAISRGHAKIIEYILPHRRFLKPLDKYIPRELVIKPGLQYKNCIELLLKWDFTIDPFSNQDDDFVNGAVENGHLEIVLQLFKLKININLVNLNTGLSLLKIACLNKHHEIVENLLKHNASLNVTTPTNTKILNGPFYSSYNKHRYNHSLSSNCNKNDLCDITCLHIAVLNSDPVMIRLLLRYGAKIIDDPTFFNITCIAIRLNCEEIVRIFLNQGVNVNDINAQGQTLLHYCVNTTDSKQDSRYDMAKFLLEKGSTIHIQTPGNSLTFEAIKNEYKKIAKLFLDYNANIQYISPDGDTPLHKAIEKDFDVEFIKMLLNLNSPVNRMNDKGQTPLHIVCKLKSDLTANKIQLLLEHNANIEAVDAKGWTPLFVACYLHNDAAVKCLLNHHANANHTDLENLTPLYIAAQNCRFNPEVVKILLEHNVNVHCINKWKKSITHVFVENYQAELIKKVFHTQVNLNSINKEGDTPLHVAVKNESVDVIKYLIKYGANVNILNKKNQTPLRNAIKRMSIYRNKLNNYRNHRELCWDYPYLSNGSDDEDYDTDDYLRETDSYKKIIKILKIQIIKLNAAGLKVNKQNLNIINNYDDYAVSSDESSDDEDVDCTFDVLQLEVDCEQEIETIRMASIGVNNMTFYDLLKKNIHYLSRFVKNKKICQTLDLEVYEKKFPLYIDIIRSRFRDAKFRYRLMHSAKKYFSIYVCPRLTDNCVDAVLSYLNIKEIKMFIRAMKPLNE